MDRICQLNINFKTYCCVEMCGMWLWMGAGRASEVDDGCCATGSCEIVTGVVITGTSCCPWGVGSTLAFLVGETFIGVGVLLSTCNGKGTADTTCSACWVTVPGWMVTMITSSSTSLSIQDITINVYSWLPYRLHYSSNEFLL